MRTRLQSRRRSKEHFCSWSQMLTKVGKTVLRSTGGVHWVQFHVRKKGSKKVSMEGKEWTPFIISNADVGSLSHIVCYVIFFLFDLDSASIKDNRNQWKLDQALVDSKMLLALNFLLHLQLSSFAYWMLPCCFVIWGFPSVNLFPRCCFRMLLLLHAVCHFIDFILAYEELEKPLEGVEVHKRKRAWGQSAVSGQAGGSQRMWFCGWKRSWMELRRWSFVKSSDKTRSHGYW